MTQLHEDGRRADPSGRRVFLLETVRLKTKRTDENTDIFYLVNVCHTRVQFSNSDTALQVY